MFECFAYVGERMSFCKYITVRRKRFDEEKQEKEGLQMDEQEEEQEEKEQIEEYKEEQEEEEQMEEQEEEQEEEGQVEKRKKIRKKR